MFSENFLEIFPEKPIILLPPLSGKREEEIGYEHYQVGSKGLGMKPSSRLYSLTLAIIWNTE